MNDLRPPPVSGAVDAGHSLFSPENPRAMSFCEYDGVAWMAGGKVEVTITDPEVGACFL